MTERQESPHEIVVRRPGRLVEGSLRDIIFGALSDAEMDDIRKQFNSSMEAIRAAERKIDEGSSQIIGEFIEEIKI